MNNIKVSIIVPVYNVEQYLKQCLDSIINQTLEEIEIICVDDGSTDNSGKICDEYSLKDKRINVIHKENTGYGKAMNIGFDNAKGKYIGIVEPDDYVLSNMYEILYNKAIETDVDFIKADFYRFVFNDFFYNKIDKSDRYYNEVINPQENLKVFDFTMNTWSGIYKKDFIEKYHIRHNETPGASFQDNGFWFQTLCRATKVYFINTPFYMNRRDNPNSSVNNKEKIFCMKQEYDYIKLFLDKNPDLKKKYLGIFHYKRFCNYETVFLKTTLFLKKKFLKVFSKDYRQAYKNKEIDKSLFTMKQLIKLYILLISSNLYYYLYLIKYSLKLYWLKNI